MMQSLRCMGILACLALPANSARTAEDSTPIRDEAHLFQADTIARAEERIDALRRTYGRTLFVETVKSAAPHERKLFRFLWTRQVNRILEEQANQRADAAGMDGIFVVICNDPKDVRVVVRPENDPDFTRHDAESLRRSIARRLQESGPDTGLLALTEQVWAILHAHATRGQSTSVVNEFLLLGLLGGGVGVWLVLSALRFKMRASRADATGEGDAEKKSFHRPALLGAMFGSPAGLWIYDKLYPDSSRLTAGDSGTKASVVVGMDRVDPTIAADQPAEERIADEPVSP